MVTIRWSDDALEDLDAISQYISQDAPENAKLFVKKVFEKVEYISDFPYAGRQVPEKGNKNLREILYNKYRIIYEIKEDILEVLTIIHQSRILNLK